MTEVSEKENPAKLIGKYKDDLFAFLLIHNIERSEKNNYRNLKTGKILCQRCTELWRLGEGKAVPAVRYVTFKDSDDVALCEMHADSIDDEYGDLTFDNMFDIDILNSSSKRGLGFED